MKLFNWLSSIKTSMNRSLRQPKRRRPHTGHFAAEMLEDRTLLSAPSFSPAAYDVSVDEDAEEFESLGSLSAGDDDDDPLSFAIIDGDPDGVFEVDETGELVLMGELDYETTPAYSLTVEVSDGTETDTATVNVTVNDVSEAPVFSPDNYDWSIDEDADEWTEVGTLSADDPQGDELSYAIIDGDPEGVFEVDEMGQLVLVGELDYETTPAYTLTVEVSDGTETDTATVNVTVNDVSEAPVMDQASYTFNVDEDANIMTSLGTVSATDPQNDELNYVILAGNEDGMFSIDSYTGDIMIENELDFESTAQYTLTVMATDGMHSDTATVTINVQNVNETPVIVDFSATDLGGGMWSFDGTVEDEDGVFAGMFITFGGMLAGDSVGVNADGTFSFMAEVVTTGTVTAQATDGGGLESDEVDTWVSPV